MAAGLPVPANATCDIYRNAVDPTTAPPAVVQVPCQLIECFRNIKPDGSSADGIAGVYTHMMYVPKDTDVRDSPLGSGNGDVVYVPDRNGTSFNVLAVARVNRGTALDMKVLYLRRNVSPNWPTDDV
jgi:hypothetical protein